MPVVTSYFPGRSSLSGVHLVRNTLDHYSDDITLAGYVTDNKPDPLNERRPVGWVYPKAYSRTVDTVRYPSGVTKYHSGEYEFTRSGIYGDVPFHMTRADRRHSWDILQRAEVKALLKLKQNTLDLGLAFAERQQTANLLGHTTARLARALNALRRRDLREVARQLGIGKPDLRRSTIPQRWLELQYGWKPLLGDIHGAVEQLTRYRHSDWVVTVKGSATDESTREHDVPGYFASRHQVIRKEGAFVRLDYLPNSTLLAAFTGFGLTNPANLAWELLPFSFVVDWVLPIGDWLQTLDAANGYDFLSGSFSQRIEYVETIRTGSPDSDSQVNVLSHALHGGSRRWFNLTRSVYSGSPIPFPPSLDLSLNVTQMASGLSLLAQAFGRR